MWLNWEGAYEIRHRQLYLGDSYWIRSLRSHPNNIGATMKPEVSLPTSRCPHPERWKCIDAMATEIEVLDMLTALVWMLKPEVIVETGCYFGFGTERLVKGVLANGFGRVYTCDIDHSMTVRTEERLCWASEVVEIRQSEGIELINSMDKVDFAFLDSGGGGSGVRSKELIALLPKLSDTGVAAIHDTGETHPDIREEVEVVIKNTGLQAIFLDTPRGFLLCKR